jgi:hypothetical protein
VRAHDLVQRLAPHLHEPGAEVDVYELMIDVEDCTANDHVIVRAWVDHLRSADLATETELALLKWGDNQWKATFSLPTEDDNDDVFAYRVGLVAKPGASWSLRIRKCRENKLAHTLLEDGDVLTTHKEWLLGTVDSHG